MTVTATPLPGHRFVGWRGAGQDHVADPTVRMVPDGPLQLEALFAPD